MKQRKDAISSPSRSETEDESQNEDHDQTTMAQEDQGLLKEEEERESLLSSLVSHGVLNHGKRKDRASRDDQQGTRNMVARSRESKKGNKILHHNEGELVYEMEESGFQDDRSSQSSFELNRFDYDQVSRFKYQKTIVYTCVSGVIAILFFALAFRAYSISSNSSETPAVSLLSNGTSNFAPTTILISLDGFRADFLQRGLTPTLNSFIAEGVSPKYMLPSFPSVTFPNHYTLVTGLYPESHGVVGNTFWDPDLQEEFYYTDPARSMQPKWWLGGEPLWVTAEQQDVKTAIHMWPGSEAHLTLEPSFLDKYNGKELLSRKVDRVLELLDTPNAGPNAEIIQRPQLIAAYVPVVDADGHLYGPNSTEIRSTIADVDTMLHDIFVGLDQRNLTNIVNIIVVSDHGMASTSTDRLIQLDDLIDLDLVDHMDGWPLYGLRPKNASDLQGLYDKLMAESAQNPNFEVYLRDQNMPERYHFSKNHRIAPLWVIPRTGWAIVHKKDFNVEDAKSNGQIYHPLGLHGYDHENPLMRAIFVARGPAFPHAPNSKLGVFQNTEVYNIVCDSLGIAPKPNNGTLRLPLKPVGLHSDDSTDAEDMVNDPSLETDNISSLGNSSAQRGTWSVDQLEHSEESETGFWTYFTAKLQAVKEWAKNTFAKAKETEQSQDS